MIQTDIDKLPEEVIIDGDIETLEVYVNGNFLRIEPSQKVHNHSSQFNWGFGGSGSAQLALAILMKFMDEQSAHKYHQPFKFKVVASWKQGEDFEVRINLRAIMSELIKQ